MMQSIILLHRWLSVAFCLLFAIWFASGIVMHFVPFPALREADRVAGLATVDLGRVEHGPAEAIGASRLGGVTRVRLLERPDGPVYLISSPSGVVAVHAADLSDAAVHSEQSALAIGVDHARQRGMDAARATVAALALFDQWTVPNGFDSHRPLYRVTLNDAVDTELYVSSRTGEVVLNTTRHERTWNYVGSVAHWIYPTALRSHQAAWGRLVWWLSLLASIGAAAGAVVGTLRIAVVRLRPASPYRGLQAWHHWLGLMCMLFVLTWILSGWLSMDDGQLFSTGKPTERETKTLAGSPPWGALPDDGQQRISAAVKEIEWFAFGGRIYRRERVSVDRQWLFPIGAAPDAGMTDRAFLRVEEVKAAASHLAPACDGPVVVDAKDRYPLNSTMPNAPVFRMLCGTDWFGIDGASGALLEKLDASRRAYRWLYQALHTLDFPALTARPALRTALIVTLCACGFVFSLTGVMLGWRRLVSSFRLVK